MQLICPSPDCHITDIAKEKYTNKIAVTSWDGKLSIYESYNHINTLKFSHPLLKCVFHNSCIFTIDVLSNLYCVSYKCSAYETELIYSFEHENESEIICFLGVYGDYLVIASSVGLFLWDKISIEIKKGRITCAELQGSRIIIGAGSNIEIYDLSRKKRIFDKLLNYTVRSVALSNDFCVVGSTCGMITFLAWEFERTFVGHSRIKDQVKIFYPVNSLKIQNNYVFSGGNDGVVKRWSDEMRVENLVVEDEMPVSVILVENEILIGFSDIFDRKKGTKIMRLDF